MFAGLTDWMRSLGVGLLLFLVVRTFVLQTFTIISGSMESTLVVGDFLVVNRAAYGATIPGTELRTPGYSAPQVGDVVVFRGVHEQPPLDVIKRIVGEPGDTLAMRDGVLYRNAVAVSEPYAQSHDARNSSDPRMAWQREYLIKGVVAREGYRATLNDWGPLVVPARRYFVLGDNRGASLDSRYWGFVARRHIVGRAELIYFSWRRGERGGSRGYPRWSRIGDRP